MPNLLPVAGDTADVSARCSPQARRNSSGRLNGNLRLATLAALAALSVVTDTAWGADLSPAPPAPVPYSWTGIYLGGNAGYASTNLTETVSGGGGTGSETIPGFVGGGQIGANYQIGAVVLGFEADIDGSRTTKSITAGIASGTAQIPWVATFRGRAGVAFDRFLVYATAGGGAAQLNATVNAGAAGSASTSGAYGGWTAGGGLEYALTDSVSVRVEDLYFDTGNINVAYVGPLAVSGRVQQNMVRAGLNVRFPVPW